MKMNSGVLKNSINFSPCLSSKCFIVSTLVMMIGAVMSTENIQLVNGAGNESLSNQTIANSTNVHLTHHEHEENHEIQAYSTHVVKHLIKEDYDRNIRPHYGAHPERIEVSIVINDISTISETEMDFEVDFYLRHSWKDPRLEFERKYRFKRLALTDEFLSKIWMPDTYIVNGKNVKRHSTIRSDKATLLRVYFDGHVFHSVRMIAELQCPMNLALFPFDKQKCVITLGSFGYTNREVQYVSMNHLEDSEKSIKLPSYKILGFDTVLSNATFITGKYSRIERQIFFKRLVGFYVSQVYAPSFLIVVISWLPFWLDRNDHLARVALGITTVLTITTLITNTNKDFEKISYLKAIDFYLFVCFVMVFMSLIEFATVGYYETILLQRTNEKRRLKKLNQQLKRNDSVDIDQIQTDNSDRSKTSALSGTSIIDQWARWLFPVTFILFNVLYFVILEIIIHKNSELTTNHLNSTENF